MILKNLKTVFKSKIGLLGFFLGFLFIAIPSYIFLDPENIYWNLGVYFLASEITLALLLAICFGIFLGATIYKMYTFRSKKLNSSGIIGAIGGILISGCPACSVTLISYVSLTFGGLTLAQIIADFPLHGLEIKIISLLILLYGTYKTLKELNQCKISFPKKK